MKWPLALRSTLNKAERDADRLRVENSNLRLAAESQRINGNKEIDALNSKLTEIVDINTRLRQDLYKAEKNDHRDPKTGRFVKGG